MSSMCECFSLYVRGMREKYFDRNLVNISRELMEATILIYDCPFHQEKQFHI